MSQRDQSLNQVWDVSTLTWVRMQQPTLEADSVTVQLPDEGQQTMANSISVAVASDQSAVPISASSLPLPSGAATETTVGKRFAGGKTTRAIRISSSGDNTVRTPASGKFIRLHWIGLNAADDLGLEVLAIVKFGATEHYRWNLGAPGAFGHWEPIDGAIDQALVINLSGARNIEVNYTVEEL